MAQNVTIPNFERSALAGGWTWLKHQYPLFILIGLVVAASVLSGAFLTPRNLTNLAMQLSVIGIVTLAQLIVVVTGGIDISVGAVLGLAAVLSAGINGGNNIWLAIAIALGVGGGLGAVSGSLIAFRGINPFIVTLGMLALARGLVYAYTEGAPLTPASPAFADLGSATIVGVPVLAIFWMAAMAFMAFLLYRTVFGRRVYAIGSNPRGAFSAGVPVTATLVLVYVIAGAMAGFGGFLLTCRIGAGTPTAGTNFELDAIAAVVIGGARLNGGHGKVFGAVVGTIIFGIITNLLVLLNVSTFLQSAFKGGLILLAVLLATAGHKQQVGSS